MPMQKKLVHSINWVIWIPYCLIVMLKKKLRARKAKATRIWLMPYLNQLTRKQLFAFLSPVNCVEESQAAIAPTFAKNNSRSLDKGKRKLHAISDEHYPFTRDSTDVYGHANIASVTCKAYYFFILYITLCVYPHVHSLCSSKKNCQVNNRTETPAVSADSMHKKRHLSSKIDLQNRGSLSNDGQIQQPTRQRTHECTEKNACSLHKGKRKVHDASDDGHVNIANVKSKQGCQINNDTEEPALSANAMHKKRHLNSIIDLQNAGSSSNDVRMYSSQERQHHSHRTRGSRANVRQGPPDTYIHMGQPDKICRHCKAIFWYDERISSSRSGRPEYHKCCNAGKVKIDTHPRDKMADADIPQFKVHLFGVAGSKQHELPTGDSIGAIVFEGGADVESEFDVIIEQSDGQPQRISKLNPSYMSLQFPLIFIYGEEGYHLNRFLLTAAGIPSDPPKVMSMKMYYAKMEQSSSIVPLSESKGKSIITQQDTINLSDLKLTDTDKAIHVKAYRKWTPTNKHGKPVIFCCMLIDSQIKPKPSSRVETPSPPTMPPPSHPPSPAKNEEPPTTPATELPTSVQPSKTTNQSPKKTARKPLFQESPDTSTTSTPKKSKKEK
ncbi:hypothetical protein CTI12_AA129720 [Artemisia annua]|uniref:Helitron helicase-like domain-containing protein n=1 Tax=Artemisia annua TaxID=35608 RepID=A0A2U1PP23_ARTAN|nr:hypothetical protein CTI12_AA129720 [Artemisia annua]